MDVAESGGQQAAGPEEVEEDAVARHRHHRFPARVNVVKVRYDEAEYTAVTVAAARARLTTSGYVACSALASAGVGPSPSQALDRELLSELLATRTALRRYAVNLNQAVAALNSGAAAPVWLGRAVEGAERAVGRVDEATLRVARRLS